MPRSRARSRARSALLLTALTVPAALVVGACGRGGPATAADDLPATTTTGELVAILRELGAGADHETHESPGDLAALATLTIVGDVQSVDDGRVFGAGPTREDEPVFLNVALTVRVVQVLGGDESLVRDGRVFVETPRTQAASVESFRLAIPADQRVVLFLDDYSAGPGAFALIEKGASIPDGSTVFAPYADGLLLVDQASGALVGGFEPLDLMAPAWREGIASLESFTATHFPTAQS